MRGWREAESRIAAEHLRDRRSLTLARSKNQNATGMSEGRLSLALVRSKNQNAPAFRFLERVKGIEPSS
jgi:hypothetical protein